MGYGHLRAASSIARRLGVPVTRADLPPLGDGDELRRWRRSRRAYETLSRAAGDPLLGVVARPLLNRLTAIARASSGPDPQRATGPVRALDRAISGGFGRRLAAEMRRLGHGLITTFYAPALAAAAHGADPVWCVVTDTDIHRIWVAARPSVCPVVYLAPTQRAADRLRSYGVPPNRVEVTGFPLPHDLVGGIDQEAARRHQERRLAVLTGHSAHPARLTFAVGGAGAQVSPARTLVRELIPALRDRRVAVTLVAGTHMDLARRFRRTIRRAVASGAPADAIEVLAAPSFAEYSSAFNRCLAGTDILWTKPSEMSFFAALGIPLVLDHPLGDHERANRDWVLAAGAGMVRGPSESVDDWLLAALDGGGFAACSEAGFTALPRGGLEAIVEATSRHPHVSRQKTLQSP
jgi:phosphoglycolate phosphatase-like HAD superfamily hydrolase